MAVIARSGLWALLFVLSATSLMARQQSRLVREQVGHVASALSDGHPQEAMDSFDKSFAGYSRIRDYFIALTDAYSVISELDINDEEIVSHEATLAIHWTLTLKPIGSNLSESRQGDLTIRLALKKTTWRIVDVSPIEFFNPEPPAATEKSK